MEEDEEEEEESPKKVEVTKKRKASSQKSGKNKVLKKVSMMKTKVSESISDTCMFFPKSS